MARKKIALLVGQPDENYQELFIKGFLKQAYACDFDVCIFAMYQKYQETKARERGESNIFSLPDYDLFDGIVILADTIQTPGTLKKLEADLKEKYDKPVICVDKESESFKTIITDHYTPVKQIISHLIEVHGFTDIAFLTGKKTHPHSAQRLQGFLDCMAEHNLTVLENRIFYGDFWYNSGVGVAEQLLRNRDKLPQAVACANDYMAIGLAGELVKAGIRVPEDIAVTGYDVLPEGRTSPEPVTSAPIPAEECGAYAVECLAAEISGKKIPEFYAGVELFIGSSCGCTVEKKKVSVLREKWEVEKNQEGFDSVANHMADDLMLQNDADGIINTIFSYVYQIRPFDSFHLCLNTDWMEENKIMGAYTEETIHAISCGEARSGLNKVDISSVFDRTALIEALFEENEHPSAYIFTPLFFEEHCFGFAAVSYGKDLRCYDVIYRKWLNTVMRGLEIYRGVNILKKMNDLLAVQQVRDTLTGFYNYTGFLENAAGALKELPGGCGFVDIIALDVVGAQEINGKSGIKGSNQIMIDFSHMLAAAILNGYMCHLGNGEFIVALISSEQKESILNEFKNKMQEQLEAYNMNFGFIGGLHIYAGGAYGMVENADAFEDLVNDAVSNKNGNKSKAQRISQSKMTNEEQKEADIVGDILDDNKFSYHFQPIVYADTGDIFAYEALMRADVEPKISPLRVLKYADYMGRLYDVEKATFTNVLAFIEKNEEKFKDKKIFINSIPGNRLNEKDIALVEPMLKKYNDKIVVELTEQAELDDEELASVKEQYEKIGIEIAVDDYGTGYSNITNLLRYMPNYVKIDRMLLSGIQLSPQKQHFVKEIIEFAHDNNFKALAEGVETKEELKMVISLGADLIQGFYTAKPSAEIVQGIDIWIQNEIIQYGQLALEQSGLKNYEAGPESSISLVKLVTGHYSTIKFSRDMAHRDIVIVGLPGFSSNMDIDIGDYYVGRIELQDASLCKHKNQPAIRIGEHCDVTIVLTGDNFLEQGGILVPENSKLTLQGDGNLTIKQMAIDGYGIGNDKDNKHGDLYFEHDGAVEISGNIMHGVAIGSGMGGNIYINRGKYVIHLSGEEGVGIGALYADVNLMIQKCNIEFDLINSTTVGIGSLYGSATISIAYIGLSGYFGANKCVCIGSMEGKYCVFDEVQATITLNARADTLCGVGCLNGDVSIYINSAAMIVEVQGKEAIAMGNYNKTANIQTKNADVSAKVKNNIGIDIGAEIFYSINGRGRYFLNGKEIVRESIEGDF
ncbi:MAG: EAL domain-containing protein [Clostridium sp.]|nr:EAL domain-containing protein [Clostridium sp.]